MKREEIIKIFEENHIAKGNATINATKLAKIFAKHESDLLKEFAEWYKKVIEQDYDDKANRMNKTKEETDWWFFNGQCTAIHRLITLLDSDLEKFLEERKK